MRLAFALLGLIALQTRAQDLVTIDWASSQPSPEGAPATIDRPVKLRVVVKNVNDILYQYSVSGEVSTAPTDDLANLLAILSPTHLVGGGSSTCDNDLTARLTKLINDLKTDSYLNPIKAGNSYPSISLAESRSAWMKLQPLQRVQKIENDIKVQNARAEAPLSDSCATAIHTQADPLLKLVTIIDARANGSHQTDPLERTLNPGQQLKITVNEYFTPIDQLLAGSPPQLTSFTTASGKSFTITPGSNILTLSAGFMPTTLGARSYVSRSVPNQTQPLLVVDNNSHWRPAAVALLNYQLPHLDWYDTGLAISAGPVIAFGSGGANVSTLGFFTGISVHLRHRLYLTPGLHFGEFADFPRGFADGTPIPSNFGTPAPVNRWTARFAIGITFQTPSFSKLASSGLSTTSSSTPANQAKTTDNKSGSETTPPKQQ